jgi:hypothetical protein
MATTHRDGVVEGPPRSKARGEAAQTRTPPSAATPKSLDAAVDGSAEQRRGEEGGRGEHRGSPPAYSTREEARGRELHRRARLSELRTEGSHVLFRAALLMLGCQRIWESSGAKMEEEPRGAGGKEEVRRGVDGEEERGTRCRLGGGGRAARVGAVGERGKRRRWG